MTGRGYRAGSPAHLASVVSVVLVIIVATLSFGLAVSAEMDASTLQALKQMIRDEVKAELSLQVDSDVNRTSVSSSPHSRQRRMLGGEAFFVLFCFTFSICKERNWELREKR